MTTTTVHGPEDVLAVLPYQLRYHPSDSAVAIIIRDGRLGMVARADLPGADLAERAAEQVLAPLLRADPDALYLIGYEEREGDSGPMLDALATTAEDLGMVVHDVVVVRDGRWSSTRCGCGCASGTGHSVGESGVSPAVAEYVGLGIAPHDDRSALEGLVLPDEDEPATVAAIEELLREEGDVDGGDAGRACAEVLHGERVAAWRRVCHLGEGAVPVDELTERERAVVALSLGDVRWRDALIARFCPGTLSDDLVSAQHGREARTAVAERPWAPPSDEHERGIATQRILARLLAVVRSLPGEAAPPLLTVIANVAWWLGDGSVARIACERALTIDPEYRLAVLLGRMLDHAIRLDRCA